MYLYVTEALTSFPLLMIHLIMHWIACCAVTLLCPYLSLPCIKGSTGSTVDSMPHINSRHPGMAPQTRGIRHWVLRLQTQPSTQLAGGRQGLKMQYLRHKVNSTGHSDHIESFMLQLLSDLKTQTRQVGCLCK